MRIHQTRKTIRAIIPAALALLCRPLGMWAQDSTQLERILQRLEHLEQQNRALIEEVRALRGEVTALREAQPEPTAAAAPAMAMERLAVAENRIEEQAQTKVEASQRFPIRLTGMALVNAYYNSPHAGGRANPTVAAREPGPRVAGATLRQTVLGLEYRGPEAPWGGRVSGSLFMDFYGGTADTQNHLLRIRTASINVDWKKTSVMVGQEKPIVSPREPNSLAQVWVSPLTNAGNLWLWEPQVRLERRFQLGENTLFRAQGGVYQSHETANIVPPNYENEYERVRPAYQGRFEFSHRFAGGSRLEIAPALHASASHVEGSSVPSRLVAFDWLYAPWRKLEFTGMLFKGKNLAGLGALRQGFTIVAPEKVIPVHGAGGWAQLSWLATSRLTFNLFGGQHDDRNSDLMPGGIGKNQAYGANLMYRITPNVIISFENLRIWTTYLGSGTARNNHYDLAVAYLF